MISRLGMALAAAMACASLVGCSSDDNEPQGSSSPSAATQAEICADLDVVGEDFDRMQQAIRAGDADAARAAMNDAQGHLVEIRSSLGDAPRNNAAAQAAGDLVGAMDGIDTTLRQAGQGGDSLLGVIQELETALPALFSSFNALREELGCD